MSFLKKYLSIQQICTSLTFQSVAKAAFSCLQSIKVTFLILHHFPRCCSPVVLFPVVTPRCGYSHGSPGRTSSRHDNGVCSPPLRCVPRCGPGPGLIFAVVSSRCVLRLSPLVHKGRHKGETNQKL